MLWDNQIQVIWNWSINLGVQHVTKSEYAHKFKKLGPSDLISFVCLALTQMHNHADSVINHLRWRGKYEKIYYGCHWKNIGHIDLIFHIHVPAVFIFVLNMNCDQETTMK